MKRLISFARLRAGIHAFSASKRQDAESRDKPGLTGCEMQLD